jgi:hypothetical protein
MLRIRDHHFVSALALTLLLPSVALWCGCRQEDSASSDAERPVAAEPPRLIFPPEQHVTDESVNEFIRHALETCLSGKYETFRELWSADEEPLERTQFDFGWDAIAQAEVRALEWLQDEHSGEVFYLLYAHVNFDAEKLPPTQPPLRRVALLVVQERGTWRLKRAPKALRRWIMERCGDVEEPASEASAEEGATSMSPEGSRSPGATDREPGASPISNAPSPDSKTTRTPFGPMP